MRGTTAAALRLASSTERCEGSLGSTVLSSTPETTTSGSRPADRSVASRAGDCDARTTRMLTGSECSTWSRVAS